MCLVTISLLLNAIFHSNIEAKVITCNGAVFNGIYYEKEKLLSGFEKPSSLVMYDASGELFFSHTIKYRNEIDHDITVCDVKTKTSKIVNGVPGGHAVAYDRIHDKLYFAGHDGIYRYDPNKRKTIYFAERGKSIWRLFIRQDFYYIEYPYQRLHVLKKGRFIKDPRINIPIHNFYVTEDYTYYYSNKSMLFRKDHRSHPTILRTGIEVRQILEDSGDVYFTTNDGLYVENPRSYTLRKVLPINQSYGATFDIKGMLIYSDNNTIYTLKPSVYNKTCLEAIRNAARKAKKIKDRLITLF